MTPFILLNQIQFLSNIKRAFTVFSVVLDPFPDQAYTDLFSLLDNSQGASALNVVFDCFFNKPFRPAFPACFLPQDKSFVAILTEKSLHLLAGFTADGDS